MQLTELQMPISDVAPFIFKRPVLTVSASETLLQAGIYLAIGPQIYVDGLAVLDGKKAVGRIGGSHIIEFILQHEQGWFDSRASEIMSRPACVVEAGDSVNLALDIFFRTGFAYVPVSVDGVVATSLCVRDTLRVVADKLEMPCADLSSELISVESDTSLKAAVQLMLEKGIRNIAVESKEGVTKLLNDRKILEYLLSHEGRQALAGTEGLGSISVQKPGLLTPTFIRRGTPARVGAEFLCDIGTPCLLLPDRRVLTPWDVVMKGARQ